jgi:hypothetical protein
MVIPKELKTAISHLPSEEKDKLIFRLLKKDVVLANRLLFELVSTETVEGQREEIKKELAIDIERATKYFYSPGYLGMDVRDMSGIINEHVSMTKDKYGEISLNLYMITEVLERNQQHIMAATPQKAEKFCTAVIARAFKMLLMMKKMHEDYWIEFQNDLEKLGMLIANTPYLMKAALHNGFDVNWLLSGNIPANIDQIHKDLRLQGFLK